mmetsp:Transcript_21521/g.59810  ORF Transcript_21521/g.59810 Transcript_21521/m.59810 type:complete len:356 (+) Transcript_21521:289-1356(+)
MSLTAVLHEGLLGAKAASRLAGKALEWQGPAAGGGCRRALQGGGVIPRPPGRPGSPVEGAAVVEEAAIVNGWPVSVLGQYDLRHRRIDAKLVVDGPQLPCSEVEQAEEPAAESLPALGRFHPQPGVQSGLQEVLLAEAPYALELPESAVCQRVHAAPDLRSYPGAERCGQFHLILDVPPAEVSLNHGHAGIYTLLGHIIPVVDLKGPSGEAGAQRLVDGGQLEEGGRVFTRLQGPLNETLCLVLQLQRGVGRRPVRLQLLHDGGVATAGHLLKHGSQRHAVDVGHRLHEAIDPFDLVWDADRMRGPCQLFGVEARVGLLNVAVHQVPRQLRHSGTRELGVQVSFVHRLGAAAIIW